MGKGKHKKIKQPPFQTGSQVKSPDAKSIEDQFADINYPVFCFKHLHKDYGLDKCNDRERNDLLKRLHTLSRMDWQQIQLTDRHTYGSEKISYDSIRVGKPLNLKKGTDFIALRFSELKPMVGYRTKFIFHIVYLDKEFKVYKH